MPMTHVPTRSEIDTRHTWNDTSVFADVDEWAAELAATTTAVEAVSSYQGRLAESPAVLAEAFRAVEKLRRRVEIILVYALMG